MRIEHVITKADVGGAQTVALELATAQRNDGHDVRIVAGTLGEMADEARRRHIPVDEEPGLRREFAGTADLHVSRRLGQRFASSPPDIVHAHSSKAGVLAREAARRHRIPAVYTAHGWPFQAGAPLRQRVVSWVGETFEAHRWGHVICLSEAEARRARRWRVVPADRLHVVANGLPDIAAEHRADLRGRTGDGPYGVVMVARFTPPKTQDGVLRALGRIPAAPWRMTFVGDGAGLGRAQALAERLHIADRVRFVGDRPDVPAILGEQDVAVLFSRYEGMPLALLEAMRSGLACVANDLPGVREMFGADGGRVVAFDEDALATELVRLLDDPAELARLGHAARRRFEESYSMDAAAAGVMRVYREVIATTPR